MLFVIFENKCGVLYNAFSAFSRGPGGFGELREASRNHFHLSWYLLVPGVTSFDQKNNKGVGVVATPHGVLPRDSH